MFESGSFKHGTGVSQHSDVDYFVSLKTSRPILSGSILASIRGALKERFPSTYIHVARPAVVLEFGQGYERVEVIPAYRKDTTSAGDAKFRIPSVVGDDWIESTPEAHLQYVNYCNSKTEVKGGAKSLARLAKAWKYSRDVPISSFYLEMRAASYMSSQTFINYPLDMYYFLKRLKDHDLAAMTDPTGNTGRIHPCSSDANLTAARSKLDRALNRAEWAVHYDKEGQIAKAFEKWDLLFNGDFPGHY